MYVSSMTDRGVPDNNADLSAIEGDKNKKIAKASQHSGLEKLKGHVANQQCS